MCNCELPEFSSTSIRTARKTHKCCECDRVVNPGDKYEYFTGKFDGGMFTYKTCLTCSQIRKWLVTKIDCCIEAEGLINELVESDIIAVVDPDGDDSPYHVIDFEDEIEIVDGYVSLKAYRID